MERAISTDLLRTKLAEARASRADPVGVGSPMAARDVAERKTDRETADV